MTKQQMAIAGLMLLTTGAYMLANIGLSVQRDNCTSECSRKTIATSIPGNLSEISKTQLIQLRNELDKHIGISVEEEEVKRIESGKSVTLNELSSIRARRDRKLPECASNERAKTFLMVFMGHSGSSAIISELGNHSQVQVGIPEPVDHQDEFDTNAALKVTRQIFDDGIRNGKTVGFKIRPRHILENPTEWRSLIMEYDTRIIWQYRKNLFKAAVGEYTNRILNDSSVVEGLERNMTREERCKIGAGCRFRVENFDFIHENLRGKIRSQRYITEAVYQLSTNLPNEHHRKACVREMPYEDYLYDRTSAMSDLLQFLGLKHEETSPGRFKATSDSMCEAVENWDELCDKFYGCVLWQHMMDDVRHGCFCRMANGFPSAKYCDVF